MDILQQIQLQQTLLSLGKTVALQKTVKTSDIEKSIQSFEAHFKPYNPRKKGYNRYGLSITSKDGGFSGTPDLDSLYEYNKERGTELDEGDFREPTPFFKTCAPLREMIAPFQGAVCRSHILRLNRGGFFPIHRDSVNLTPTYFRLIISLSFADHFVFLLDNERIFFEKGRMYFFNSRLAHCIFSFEDKSDFAVFNIELCEESVEAVRRNLFFK